MNREPCRCRDENGDTEKVPTKRTIFISTCTENIRLKHEKRRTSAGEEMKGKESRGEERTGEARIDQERRGASIGGKV